MPSREVATRPGSGVERRPGSQVVPSQIVEHQGRVYKIYDEEVIAPRVEEPAPQPSRRHETRPAGASTDSEADDQNVGFLRRAAKNGLVRAAAVGMGVGVAVYGVEYQMVEDKLSFTEALKTDMTVENFMDGPSAVIDMGKIVINLVRKF